MNWEQASSFCSDKQAEMVVLDSKEERQEVAKLIAPLLAKRWRFWGKSTSGNCFRIGGDMKWYRAPCGDKGVLGGYTLNPFCKKKGNAKEFGIR